LSLAPVSNHDSPISFDNKSIFNFNECDPFYLSHHETQQLNPNLLREAVKRYFQRLNMAYASKEFLYTFGGFWILGS
jgi:hypothetical protein